MQGEIVHKEKAFGFDITLSFLPEYDDPRDHFAGEPADDEETFRNIESGKWLWFCAKVTASKAGVELASDYLGACCYESADAFMRPQGYYQDMCASVVNQARAKLAELCT